MAHCGTPVTAILSFESRPLLLNYVAFPLNLSLLFSLQKNYKSRARENVFVGHRSDKGCVHKKHIRSCLKVAGCGGARL